MHALLSFTYMSTASPCKQGCASLVRASAPCALRGWLNSPVPARSLWPRVSAADTLLPAKAGSSPTWKPSFSELSLGVAFQEEQLCGHTVTSAYANKLTKDMLGIIHQVRALSFCLGMNCLQQIMKYHLYLLPSLASQICKLLSFAYSDSFFLHASHIWVFIW